MPLLALADAHRVDDFQWEGVERIVAIGDIHGDYDNYLATLRLAGLIDKRDRWAGGKTHFVQTGDIPDRGPDTRKIIEHITRLAEQAERKGGMVHSLIGNHEAMNVYGDLRYVSQGEFEAFVTRNSAKLRDRYYDLYLKAMEQQQPEQFAALPENYRDEWNLKHPLGWVEHRQAWDPAWNANGEYAKWVLSHKVSIRINDVVFVHGGISGLYCRNTLDSLTDKAIARLSHFDPQNPGILEDPFGPLWYRGLSGVEPEALPETVDAVLAEHQAKHIVVGHTPTSGVIWPNYGGRVLMIDTGISKVYGGHIGYLEITPEGYFAGYPGGKVALPTSADGVIPYLEKVVALQPGNKHLQRRLEQLRHPPESQPATGGAQDDQAPAGEEEDQEVPAVDVPICGISQ
jgi:hypothetical protein